VPSDDKEDDCVKDLLELYEVDVEVGLDIVD